MKWVFVTPQKFCPLAVGKGRFALPVDRPVNRPNGHFYDRCASGRPSGRPGLDTESSSSLPVDRPVDRGHFQRAELSGRSTGPPAHGCVHVCACQSTDRSTGPVDRQTARSNFLGIKNLSFCLLKNPIKYI